MLAEDVKFRSMEHPAIAVFGGVTYVVPGWHPIPTGTTLKEVEDHWEKVTYPDKPTTFPKHEIEETVVSKRTGEKYTVSFHTQFWSCTCMGYGFRGKCKHIEEVKQKYLNK